MVRFSSFFFSESLSKNPSKSVIVLICFSYYIKYVFESIQVKENQILLNTVKFLKSTLVCRRIFRYLAHNHKIKNLTKLSNSIIYKKPLENKNVSENT